MKKLFGIIIAVGFFLGVVFVPVSAQTVSFEEIIQTLEEQIELLKAKIKDLEVQLESLKQAKGEIKETVKEIKATLKLTRQLDLGMSNEDVKLLQEILATDPEIYPEGLISGYFGPLTERAVKKFQKAAGIEQIGRVGPKTISKINELLEEGAGESGKVPPGLLIAPGIRKKLGYTPEPPAGQELPPGISKKIDEEKEEKCINSGGTVATSSCCLSTNDFPNLCLIGACGCSSENSHEVKICNCGLNKCFNGEKCRVVEEEDITPPVISGITATTTLATSTKITWITNEEANSKVYYDVSTPLTVATSTPVVSSANLVLNHEITLTGLTASTTYYYLVTSADEVGNNTTSSEQTITTLSE